jgi:hypothetical protein
MDFVSNNMKNRTRVRWYTQNVVPYHSDLYKEMAKIKEIDLEVFIWIKLE